MGISLLRGRDVSESDDLDSPGVVIINQRLAQKYWPGEDPIGKRITLDHKSWLSVIGVAHDAKQNEWVGDPRPEMYLPLLQSSDYLQDPAGHFAYITLVARATGDPVRWSRLKSVVARHRPERCCHRDRNHGPGGG